MNTTDQSLKYKQKVTQSFSKATQRYHEQAEVQKKVAEGLIASVRPWKGTIPPGPILEVGCGTGFLSEKIIQEFPSREFTVTDASKEMLHFTQKRLNESDNLSFEVLDVDHLQNPEPKYALIVSNFTAQWFDDTAIGLEKLAGMLKPGGLLLTSFPGNHSFTEWYECCLELGLPFTANPLPDVEEVVVKLSLSPVQIDYYENDLYQEFNFSIDFFRHLKEVGADVSTTGKSLTAKQLKLLTDFWNNKVDNQIKVKWHVVYVAVKKDMI
ncbi:MAG: methyltransferase domain-containing protein [Balneolaceae bacterium]|nr:methyltransferase domain-containing protein [Balneolaceae bacterium]MBO6547494.1 methyltransferase domain-containing protein [Balneolaceae bacterium]MBO6647559.1 methyltransferase domain-containing protein [Balneolaceae bacterium]